MNQNNNNDIFDQNNEIIPLPPVETEITPKVEDVGMGAANNGEAECAFRWEYSDQIRDEAEKNKKRKKKAKKGAFVYAVIMISAFLLAFSILALSLSVDDIFGTMADTDKELSIVEIVEKGMPSSVMVISIKDDVLGSGSGFVVNDYGYVVTNYHVVENSIDIVVADASGEQYSADLVGYDAEIDVALLYVEQLDAPSVVLADSDNAKLGETVVAIGCPAGGGSSLSVSNGIISGFDRFISSTSVGAIQTNAPLNPGNSGGPLFDSHGNVVGIVTAKRSYDVNEEGEKVPLEGIAYAIPINAVKDHVKTWINADLQKPMLGIHAIEVESGKSYFYEGESGHVMAYSKEGDVEYKINSAGEATALTPEEINNPQNIIIHSDVTGLFVVKVTKGLGADGKLMRGDIMTELDGVAVKNTAEVRAVFNTLTVGDSVNAKVYRNGNYSVIKMTLKTKGDMLAAEKIGG